MPCSTPKELSRAISFRQIQKPSNNANIHNSDKVRAGDETVFSGASTKLPMLANNQLRRQQQQPQQQRSTRQEIGSSWEYEAESKDRSAKVAMHQMQQPIVSTKAPGPANHFFSLLNRLGSGIGIGRSMSARRAGDTADSVVESGRLPLDGDFVVSRSNTDRKSGTAPAVLSKSTLCFIPL